MQAIPHRFRYGLVAAVSLALFVGGVVSGAAGNPLILGTQNVSGSATTELRSNVARGAVLYVAQDGRGSAVMGETSKGSAGSFISTSGIAVNGVGRDQDAFGLVALNGSDERGSGAALRASSDANSAIVATSSNNIPLFIAGPDDRPPMAVNSSKRVTQLNADATDGWSIGCPENTVLSQGLCFQHAPQALASSWDAADSCQALDVAGFRFRLPSVQQLRSARGVEGIDIDVNGEHTDSIQSSGDALQTLIVFDDGRVATASADAPHRFRCVAEPLAVDVSLVANGEANRYPPVATPLVGAAEDGSPAK
jgi:hypothetical protein